MAVGLPLNASGGDGGDIAISAGTTLQTSSAVSMNVGANGDAGNGGSVDLSAVSDLTIGGETTGMGSPAVSSDEGQAGGDGADLAVFSETGTVTVNGKIDVSGAAAGFGGGIDIDAGLNLSVSKAMVAQGSGVDGTGGVVFLLAGGTMALPQQIDVRGGPGSGGSIEAFASGDLTVAASLLADGSLLAGSIFLAGCAVNVTSQALLSAQGPGAAPAGINTVQASSTMTISGTLRASTQNLLQHRAPPAPSLAGAVSQPPATIQLQPALPCCVNCPVTTTTTTNTSTTIIATTTTTSSTTTTTTVPSVCGDGVVTGAEQCDDGNTVGGDCCSASCTFETANSPCADESNPCTRDVCNGTGVCTHPAGNAGATCRSAAGACDQAETCSGTSATCPADVKRTSVCRVAEGACDVAESCDGVSNACPPDGFAPAGTECRAVAGVCDIAEACTGTSAACPTDAFVPDGTTCDGDACTTGGTCQGGLCSGQEPTCGACETCDPVAGCITAPRSTCRRPVESAKAQLELKDSLKGPANDQLKWKWTKGAATAPADFGDPVTSDGLALCIFDRSQATPSLLFRATVPPGGVCDTRPCWVGKGGKFKLTSKTGEPDGVTGLALTSGEAGKAKIQLKAKGLALTGRPFGMPAPPLLLPLTVQLQSENGQCWEANYSTAKKNAGEAFDAKAD